jgi:hypothetical protein
VTLSHDPSPSPTQCHIFFNSPLIYSLFLSLKIQQILKNNKVHVLSCLQVFHSMLDLFKYFFPFTLMFSLFNTKYNFQDLEGFKAPFRRKVDLVLLINSKSSKIFKHVFKYDSKKKLVCHIQCLIYTLVVDEIKSQKI